MFILRFHIVIVIEDENKFNNLSIYDYILIYTNIKKYKTIQYSKIDKFLIHGFNDINITNRRKEILYSILYRQKILVEFPNFYNLIKNYNMNPLINDNNFIYKINDLPRY